MYKIISNIVTQLSQCFAHAYIKRVAHEVLCHACLCRKLPYKLHRYNNRPVIEINSVTEMYWISRLDSTAMFLYTTL